MKTIQVRKIKDFTISGALADNAIHLARDSTYRTLFDMMRDSGHVRILDLDPTWVVEYNSHSDKWTFSMTIHGVYVGDDAWQYEGITQSKLIPRNIHQPTLDL